MHAFRKKSTQGTKTPKREIALIAAADFSRIRNADLARFTPDRPVGIINRLGARARSS